MKKLAMMAAAGAILVSTHAGAMTSPAYDNKGECKKAIAWAAYDSRLGIPNPLGALSPDARCEKIGAKYYVVDGSTS